MCIRDRYNSLNGSDVTSGERKKIVNTFSNGTNVYLLKINTLENNQITATSTVKNENNIDTTVVEEIMDALDIPNQPNLKLSRYEYDYNLGSKVRPIKYLINYKNIPGLAGKIDEEIDEHGTGTGNATQSSINTFGGQYSNREIISYYPLNGSVKGSWSKSSYTSEAVIIDGNSFINYVNPENAHNNETAGLKPFLYLLKSKPISSQYGSKVHNYFYEPLISTLGSEVDIKSPARSVVNIISPLDSTDGSSNIAEDANGTRTFDVDTFGIFTLKYTPKSLGTSSFYSIPYTITRRSTNAEFEAAIIINLVAKYLIELDDLELICTDRADHTFKLPYQINDSAPIFSEYSDVNYIYNNITFEIISQSVDMDDIGTFIFDPNNEGKFEDVKFIPKHKTITQGSTDNSDWILNPPADEYTLAYKILFDGVEYTNRNNIITLKITNTYQEPVIESSMVTLDLNTNIKVRFSDIILRDETMELINISSIRGPYNGSYTILDSTNNIHPGYKILQYTPNPNYLGMDYIFFTATTDKARTPIGDLIVPDVSGSNPSDGYIKFMIVSSTDDSQSDIISVIDDIISDDGIIDDDEVGEEICPCPKETYKPFVTATVEPRSTLADWVSSRARNLYAYPKKVVVVTQSNEERKTQVARKVLKIKNF